ALKNALDNGQELVAAKDAIVWLGGPGGIKLQQSSNTFTAIGGVSITFTRAMSVSEPLATLTVAANNSATADNVRKFVDAYNALKKSLDELTKPGDPSAGTKAAAFASDAGVRSLRSRLSAILRQEFDGLSLLDLGIRADRQGNLSLDTARLEKTLAADPEALEKVFGKATLTTNSGVLGAMNEAVDDWLRSSTGQIARRQESLQLQQKSLAARQARLDAQYESLYQRYLMQFTQLQRLQEQMSQTSSLFSVVPSG
ncbi:MAG TPA: flagellar filament capping protein FliD, partial [Steroidobacteraceae bacterium]